MPDPIAVPANDTNATARRAIAIVAGFTAPFIAGVLKAKLGIDIPTEQIVAVETALVLYLGQSVVNEVHARAVAANPPKTPAAAVADLNAGPAK